MICVAQYRLATLALPEDRAFVHASERRDIPMSQQSGTYRTLRIGDDCWFGAGATVTEDVGTGAIVAAGAVVVDPVEPYTIVGGNPARVIGTRP